MTASLPEDYKIERLATAIRPAEEEVNDG